MKDSSRTPQVCVVGGGYWGKNLVRNFHCLNALRGICDSDENRLKQLGEQYPGVPLYKDLGRALDDPAIDAVAIATPAETHCSITLEALSRGKDCFVEKPLALTAEEGNDMVREAYERGRVLMVGHLMLYHPAVRVVAELVRSGELGRLEYIYSNRLSMGKIRREENALWSFAPHDISLLLMLTGKLPLQVTAVGGAYLQPNIADVTVSNLLFERGMRAHIFVSWLHPHREQRLVVIGSRKMIVFEETKPTDKLLLFEKQVELRDGSFEAQAPKGVPVAYGPEEPLRLECGHFLQCVEKRERPHTSGEQGVQVLQILQACQTSLQLNGEPVQVGAGVRTPVLAL